MIGRSASLPFRVPIEPGAYPHQWPRLATTGDINFVVHSLNYLVTHGFADSLYVFREHPRANNTILKTLGFYVNSFDVRPATRSCILRHCVAALRGSSCLGAHARVLARRFVFFLCE